MKSDLKYMIKTMTFGLIVGAILGTVPVTVNLLVYDIGAALRVAYTFASVLGGITGLLFSTLSCSFLEDIKVRTILAYLSSGTLAAAIPFGLMTALPFLAWPAGIMGYWAGFFILIFNSRKAGGSKHMPR